MLSCFFIVVVVFNVLVLPVLFGCSCLQTCILISLWTEPHDSEKLVCFRVITRKALKQAKKKKKKHEAFIEYFHTIHALHYEVIIKSRLSSVMHLLWESHNSTTHSHVIPLISDAENLTNTDVTYVPDWPYRKQWSVG